MQLSLRPEIMALEPWITKLYHDLHQHPEPGMQELYASEKALALFQKYNFTVKSPIAVTGLAAIWDSGRPGPTLAIRADMDALPLVENPHSFSSLNDGYMHACGHDLHMTMLLATARLLAENSNTNSLCGKVMFICQPAEETHGGAKLMLEDKLYDFATPEIIFSCHIDPLLPTGNVAVADAAAMAAAGDFVIEITGHGGHAAMPWDAESPWTAAGRVITLLTETPQPEGILMVLTNVNGGKGTNIIPDRVTLSGTFRYHYTEHWQEFEKSIQATLEKLAKETNRSISLRFDYDNFYPPTRNHPNGVALIRKVATGLLGAEHCLVSKPPFTSEDFAFFLEQTDGAFFWLGACHPETSTPSGLHTASFMPDPAALFIGTELWLRLIETYCASS